MIMTDEWVDIMDHSDLLCTMVLSSEQFYHYLDAHRAVYTKPELVREINYFTRLKDQYEEVQRFGKYHPDYSRVMKDIRVTKRNLDMVDEVAALRVAENELQDLLDEVSLIVGKSVSEGVKVPVSNPFFASSSSSCGSGCGSGGSCSCSA
ncbi:MULTISPECIES: YlbF family regulator [Psychrobacillus]|uniref:YlbF family regulator n=1 Tax=Psychrobacillus faecigallinarum TaxID=2762235 RepID=A0ABR8R537_9BACI|nr:YlbF family regulator [Psychrobacillus faecigallinarum]MBD7942824.1 YlbF family regulator [Psychrobacillus faecigallinarum]QGM30830.1 YlbF family regulator [Bacillus sp. N3536]